MIIIKLKGGLGNQLFQYALGRSIAITQHKEVKFDLSWFDNFKRRKYSLCHFNTRVNIANKKEIISLKKWERRDGYKYLPLNLLRKKSASHVKETGCCFKEEILKVPNNTYLDGNWQHEMYFKAIENQIRKEITLKKKAGSIFNNLVQVINKSNSISLHVRRGDYTTEKVQRILQLCTLDYYHRAISSMEDKVSQPTFFVFSDDIKWCKDNIKLKSSAIFVSGKGLEDYEELILMSKCRHNIIANSTFSWWGAWLNDNPNKIIIAPRKWFSTADMEQCDIIPHTWTTL